MTSILIIENQEPGDCATCPMCSRYAGICHLTLKFAGEGCPLRKASSIEDITQAANLPTHYLRIIAEKQT